MDKKLSSFFLSQSERLPTPKFSSYKSAESTTSEVKRQSED
jgi:hypothetical protein